ncbi:hypothetical protein BOQ62_00270 [Chryseobacterium sp. CH21]|uniref:hypothetical protein n=1 Tax=Chryseobacterium sp. CH21 TaxID=713556 RepID=UPI00100AC209|nr:hypothetical protein [Chryseobacterium sp. CH21]RXM41424.1 hypothetical protein BOQ62_00270 [Chryseobacterium sp. CH21]
MHKITLLYFIKNNPYNYEKITLSIVIALTTFSAKTIAQVGINTTTPAATLDIIPKNSTGTSTTVDGLLVPRVDRQRAQSMASVPVSTLIYVNSTATGTQTGTAINIDAVGFYYYNGTAWVKISPPLNIYNTNGTLTGNRTVTQGASTLAFTSNIVNGFSVAGNTFSADGANSRIGIGTAAPTTKLHVEGSQFLNAAVTGAATKDALNINVGQDGFLYGNRTDNFGINIRTNSSADTGPIARINFGDISTGTISGNGQRYMSFSVGKPLNELMYLTNVNGGNVGIGTISPNTKLEVNSGTAGISGMRFTNLTSATTVGAGQTLGVDNLGNVVTLPNPTTASVTTFEVASTTEPTFNVSDTGYTIISGTSQNVTIPAGGKTLFINFMLGIDYLSLPPGSGGGNYQATLFIDGVATNEYMVTQESGVGLQTQFSLSSVKFLTAGSHTLDVRMRRSANNGTTPGALMTCSPISMSFNASYIN